MANDKENYKEGIDFEFRTVKSKDGKTAYKNRHFFTKAEKDAMKAPKAAPTAKAAPKAKVKPATKGAMKGYRKGDVNTSPLATDLAKATRSALATPTKPKAAIKQPKRPITSEKLAGPFTKANVATMGDYTETEYNLLPPQARVSRGLPKTLGAYAVPPGTFKASKQSTRPTRPTDSVKRAINAGGQYATVGYAKGGTVKKKKAC